MQKIHTLPPNLTVNLPCAFFEETMKTSQKRILRDEDIPDSENYNAPLISPATNPENGVVEPVGA